MNTSSRDLIEMDDPVSPEKRFGLAVVAILAGLVCLYIAQAQMTEPSQAADRFGFAMLGGLLFLAAGCTPLVRRKWIDLGAREFVETTRYAGLVLVRKQTPLSSFTRVIVRHLAHEGEGDTSYTSDVGLEAADRDPVIWVKSFPCSEKGIDDAAREFGRSLQDRIGLPGNAEHV